MNPIELRSEFAHIIVEMNLDGNGPRLMIRDVKTDKVIYLDPLELECIAWADHRDLSPFLNPSYRWTHEHEGFARDLRELGLDSR